MKSVNVEDLTKNAVAQTMGVDYMEKLGDLSALDSYKLADVGKDVLDSGSLDVYVKTLLSQMGKMIIESKKYTAELPSLFIESFDWGGYIERVYFSPQDVISDEMYNLVDGQSYDDHKFYKPKASAKIFEEAKTIAVPISIVRDQIQEAFQNMTQMNAFLSGIYTNVENTITLCLEAYAHMLISCGIAISDKATSTARHLLAEAKAKGIADSSMTSEEAVRDEKVLTYAMQEIEKTRYNMHRFTTAFNNKSVPVFTNDSDSKLALLNDFTSNVKYLVKANTYNDELIGVGSYDTVTSWQAFRTTDEESSTTTNFEFETNSSIMISADSDNKLGIGTDAYTGQYCIGICYDTRAMGICPHREKVTSNYTAIADFWNTYYHQLFNYIIDANFSMVAFFMD